MKKHILILLPLVLFALQSRAEDINSSVSLQTYYATANGTLGNALRTVLQDAIKNHTQIGYKNLGTIMQWSDTENADGEHVVDIYTNCDFIISGSVTWSNTSAVGGGMNREHTVPQSWFSEQEPMKSDAFHVYPTDCKANNNRSSFLYGECPNGTSSTSSACTETGKKGSSGWTAGQTYTCDNQTYTTTTGYTGTVYEPDDEYKGDLARSYFYMATRYAGSCESWSGGAFGSENNGLNTYTAELMLKWHRLDPVSEKELIRNEVIYGNEKYNKSDKKQGNRNPFIDYPELVEYIWGEKQAIPVVITALDSPYANETPEINGFDELPTAPAAAKILRDGQLLIVFGNQIYNVMGQRIE